MRRLRFRAAAVAVAVGGALLLPVSAAQASGPCDDYEPGFSRTQCENLHNNTGFAPLPGSPENPGTPKAAAPQAPSKAAPKVTPKAPTKPKVTKKAPVKKKPVKKASTSKRR